MFQLQRSLHLLLVVLVSLASHAGVAYGIAEEPPTGIVPEPTSALIWCGVMAIGGAGWWCRRRRR
jgi:hypothetical protein